MANMDTVVVLFGGTGRGQIAALSLTSATETLFVVNTDTTGTTPTAVLTLPTGNTGNTLVGSGSPIDINQNPAISSAGYGRIPMVFTEPPFYSTRSFDSGRPFRLRLVGTASVGAVTAVTVTNTVNVSIYAGSAITATYKIATLTASGSNSSTTATVTNQFCLEALVQWDSIGQTLSGYYGGNNGNTYKAGAALANAVAVTSAAGLIFSATGTFALAAGGSVTISEFSAEKV